MAKQQKSTSAPVDVDRFTSEELAERVQRTMQHIGAIKAEWPGLVRLEEHERRRSLGRNLSVLGPPLQSLFSTLRGNPALAKAFDVLGDQDEGHDPERFETELLERRLARVQAQQKIADALEDLARHLDDDVLATGQSVLGPGLLALELSRTLSKGSPAFRSALVPVLDAFRELTKRARKGRADAAADKTAAAAEGVEPESP